MRILANRSSEFVVWSSCEYTVHTHSRSMNKSLIKVTIFFISIVHQVTASLHSVRYLWWLVPFVSPYVF